MNSVATELDSLISPRIAAAKRRSQAVRCSILGTGKALPDRVVDNGYFVDQLGLETTVAWIESRTGIRERRFSRPTTGLTHLATEAGLAALECSGVDPSSLSLIIVATSTADNAMPSTACLVQRELLADRALAFDLNAACSGFVYAFDVATRYLQTLDGNALVIGADLATRLVNPVDRGTSIFFGDGAGAGVLSATGKGRLLASELHSDGDDQPLIVPRDGSMRMDGRAIWDFATRVLPQTIRSLCAQADVAVEDLCLVVPHQANVNILRAAAESLGLPMERVVVNLDRYGNTMAASIPIALDEAVRAGRLASGDLVALVGFGAGLAWGGQLLQI